MSIHNLCLEQKCEKYQDFLSEIFHFLVVKFSVYLNRPVFVMNTNQTLTKLASNNILSLSLKSQPQMQQATLLNIFFLLLFFIEKRSCHFM